MHHVSADWTLFGTTKATEVSGDTESSDLTADVNGWMFLSTFMVLLMSKKGDNVRSLHPLFFFCTRIVPTLPFATTFSFNYQCLTIPWRTIRKIKFAERKKSTVMSVQLKDIKHLTIAFPVEDDLRTRNLFQEFAFPATPKDNPCFAFFGAYPLSEYAITTKSTSLNNSINYYTKLNSGNQQH